jgi:hypothetical protein
MKMARHWGNIHHTPMRNALKITIALALLAVPATALAASHQVRAIGCARELYKPTRITLSCGDGGIWLGGLTWSSWHRSRAVATGTYNEIICTPTCSAGSIVSRPVTVTLSRPKACPGRIHLGFGMATFTFPSGTPPSAYHHRKFRCPF